SHLSLLLETWSSHLVMRRMIMRLWQNQLLRQPLPERTKEKRLLRLRTVLPNSNLQ
ncbi:Hypothetical predicted protein, partial [Prunus dulcis]